VRTIISRLRLALVFISRGAAKIARLILSVEFGRHLCPYSPVARSANETACTVRTIAGA
jgi:hypothetical protein